MLRKGVIIYPILFLLSFGPTEFIRILQLSKYSINDDDMEQGYYFIFVVLLYLNGLMNSITFFILRY